MPPAQQSNDGRVPAHRQLGTAFRLTGGRDPFTYLGSDQPPYLGDQYEYQKKPELGRGRVFRGRNRTVDCIRAAGSVRGWVWAATQGRASSENIRDVRRALHISLRASKARHEAH